MAQLVGIDEIESLRNDLSDLGRSLRSSFRKLASGLQNNTTSSSLADNADDERLQLWAEIDRLPTFERLRSSLFNEDDEDVPDAKGMRVIDVTKLGPKERQMFIEKLIKHTENDNLRLLHKLRKRMDKVGVKLPTVEDCSKIAGMKPKEAKISIIDDVSGIIKPGRITLLLGPPGCGKTSLLKALSGNLDKSLKIIGDISYNGYKLEEFVPQKTSAYISQTDLHIPEMTVRETLDFSAQCQGVGRRAEIMAEVSRREKDAGVVPDPDIDMYMKAISVEGQKTTVQTNYILKILGLDVCADVLVGDAMKRGISGGQKKRLTTGEMIISPTKALCPERKGVADFLQEVMSRKDQAQYWYRTEHAYTYVSVGTFSEKFKESPFGKNLEEEVSEAFLKSKIHDDSISFDIYSISKWNLFKACMSREFLLMRRNSFIYIFKSVQLIIIASITMTVPEPGRFFRHLLLLFAVHWTSVSMFRFVASLCRNIVVSTTAGSLTVLLVLLFGGFIIPKSSMPVWLKWAFWFSPLAYGEIGLTVNEFLAPRWQKSGSTNTTIGLQTLENRGLDFTENFYWISVGALFGFTLFFNIGFVLALSFLKPPGSRAIFSSEKLSPVQRNEEFTDNHAEEKSSNRERMALPFEPISIVFQDVQYYVDTPLEMRERGFSEKKLQLLHDITGALRPGVLTALMGVTIEESVTFSAWLRLHPHIDAKTKNDFVKDVLETVELDGIKDALVGIPGVSGLSTEQRKRLTIAVELVSNPSIIFMDEPTTGLDARAAAIVMRAVKNVVQTGRTIVCTIHQPSIDIFEAFDELILLKLGGHLVYSGSLGQNSSKVIEYFEGISGVPKIKKNYNPATWMLEVTSRSAEVELDLDFAQVYQRSALHEVNKEQVNLLSKPPSGSKDLFFPTRYSQNGWGQFKNCLWKQHLSYWRSPSYNLTRSVYMTFSSFLFGMVFWDQGKKIDNQQSLFNILDLLGCMRRGHMHLHR
ncbi:hypothetical protein POM88_030278 [Heracleum sosnowskyi]|uniref:ABC transporter domain-containing protein n=1 Tax=Heracleum sosnowskyi TaxID=360622 RepID=A0AAD8MFL8_9APIA|nr:hypothetical protein POM88_030278 [Heracleum sosnowskyi]